MGKGNKRFEQLYESHYAMVFQLCMGFLKGHQESAKDLAHETFLNAWRAFDRFQEKASSKTWLYRIAVNTCLKYLRDSKLKASISLEDGHSYLQSSEEKVDHEYKVLYRAIGQLRELDRLIIMMVLDELEYKEIAEVVGITETNLRVKIHRIKNQLKKLLQNE
jgi:RNA polymerase sigma-70 factor (ECF subfamily)